jgi:hypothetical protein
VTEAFERACYKVSDSDDAFEKAMARTAAVTPAVPAPLLKYQLYRCGGRISSQDSYLCLLTASILTLGRGMSKPNEKKG